MFDELAYREKDLFKEFVMNQTITQFFANIDFVWVGIVACATISLLVFLTLFSQARRQGYVVSESVKIGLIISSAVGYSMALVAFPLYLFAPFKFTFLWWQKSVINSGWTIATITLLYIATEIAARVWFEKEKRTAVESFNGKRTSASIHEGMNWLPGLLPLMVEVFIYAFYRVVLGYNAVRSVDMSPIVFNETVVVYTRDNKAVVLVLTATWRIVDAYVYEDALDTNTQTLPEQRRPLIDAVKELTAQALYNTAKELSFEEVQDKKAKNLMLGLHSITQKVVHGLKLQNISNRFVRFENDALQELFQSIAGSNMRSRDTNAKRQEVKALFDLMHKDDPSFTMRDAERMWETFHKGDRGNYGFSFS